MDGSSVSELDHFRNVGGIFLNGETLHMEQFAEEKARDFS